MISERIFRAYDIRGIYGVDLDVSVANLIGKALATYVNGGGKTFIVGRDLRLSSKPLSDALISGMVSCGLNVEDIGVVTTPLLYFATKHYGVNGGVIVSASHNPPEWNGFKILLDRGFLCLGMGMEELRDITLKGAFKEARYGTTKTNPNAIKDYTKFISEKVSVRGGLKIAADPGGGACTVLIQEVYERAGLKASVIYGEPDGSFTRHPPEPNEQTLSELREIVLREGASFGVGFDGDGDRAIFMDDRGRMVPGSVILALLTKHYLERNRGAAIVYEVSCSMIVEETIRAYGGKPILSRVGHTYIYEKMVGESAVLGGEASGHFYFRDTYGFDDAIFASLKVAEALSEDGRRLSEIVDSIPRYPQIPTKNYDCPDEKKFIVVDRLAEEFRSLGHRIVAIDGVKVIMEDGWFLIRPSNTQPLIRLTVEARDKEKLEEIASYAEKAIVNEIKRACEI